MQVFILQYFTRIVKNLKKRENTENLCLLIRGSQVQVLVQEPLKIKRLREIATSFSLCTYPFITLSLNSLSHRDLRIHGCTVGCTREYVRN